jgi:hypothetical protein
LTKFKYLFTGISNIYNIFIKYIVLYDEIHLKYCRDTVAYREIEYLLQQWKNKLRENARWNVNKNNRCLVRNKIKHRKKYKIGKSPTPEGKISIVLFTRLAELENDCNLTLGCRRFPYLVHSPVLDSIYLYTFICLEKLQREDGQLNPNTQP